MKLWIWLFVYTPTWLDSVSVVFHYNSVPPNVPGVIIAMQPIVPSCHLFAQTQHYNVCITAAAVYGFCQTWGSLCCFCVAISLVFGFRKGWFWFFVKKSLSWLIEWQHWSANGWHAVRWCHISDCVRSLGTKKKYLVPGNTTKWKALKNWVEPSW